MRQHRALFAILFATAGTGAALAADGMAPPKDADVWPQWQARITVSTATLAPVRLTADAGTAPRQILQSGALFSDYYFDMPGLRLPAATGGLRATSGLVVEVRAAPEAVSTARADDALLLARAAYHLGNRHVALQLGPGWLRYPHDHVLDNMARELGLTVNREQAPFEPEAGAYQTHDH